MTTPLYPVPSGGYNGVNAELFPAKVISKAFSEWVQNTPLKHMMSADYGSPIVLWDTKPGEGLQFRVPRFSALDTNVRIMDSEQKRGKAQRMSVDSCSIDSHEYFRSVSDRNRIMMRQGTPVDIPSMARSQLSDYFSAILNIDLFDAMTKTNYPDMFTSNASVLNAVPSYDRSVTGVPITSVNWYAASPFKTVLNAFTAGLGGINTAHFAKLKKYAEQGGSIVGREAKIQPSKVLMKDNAYERNYIYLANPDSLNSLYSDPLFQSVATARGVIVSKNQPQMISGADYVGEYLGIHIYAVPELRNYTITNTAGTSEIAWNLMLGAGALGLSWTNHTQIAYEFDKIEDEMIYFAREFRGQAALKYSSLVDAKAGVSPAGSRKVEQGIIHSFVNII